MQITSHNPNPRPESDPAGGLYADTLQPDIRARRVELLIAPRDLTRATDARRLADSVGDTLDLPHSLHRRSGDFDIFIIADGRPHSQPDLTGDQNLCLVEGLWPEPVGLHLETFGVEATPSWVVESDHYGVRPIFFGFDSQKRPIVSTRPDVVAALLGSRPSVRSIAEHLLIGFNLDDHSPYDGVHRLRPGERLLFSGPFGFRLGRGQMGDSRHHEATKCADWIESTAPIIVEAFQRGDALELSGGVDSRLVLALGLHHGTKPRLAFTLGREDDEDVAIASEICTRLGIEHYVLPVELDASTTVADGLNFVRRAGFGVNACSYAWLPSAFRRLAPFRTHQIGGGGGECATGFYYSPFDALCSPPSVRLMWVHKRLFQSGIDLEAMFGPHKSCELTDDIAATAAKLLDRMEGSWRQRTDELYLTQRVPNSGGAVLSASACWYRPLQPLLRRPYIEWGRNLSPARRSDRHIQMRTIHKLHPELGAMPYSAGRLHASSPVAMIRKLAHKAGSSAKKIARRLSNRRAAADLGAATTAAVLAGDEGIRQSLERLANCTDLSLRPERLARMLASPGDYEHELGALITAAGANDSVQSLTSRWRTGECRGLSRRAA